MLYVDDALDTRNAANAPREEPVISTEADDKRKRASDDPKPLGDIVSDTTEKKVVLLCC